MPLRPLQHLRETRPRVASDRIPNILRLPALAMRRNHQPAGQLVRDFRSIVAAHDVQTQIDPRRASGRGQNLTLLGVQNIRFHPQPRELRDQPLGMPPVGRRALAVQKASRGQDEHTRADRHQPRPLLVSLSQRANQCRRRRFAQVFPPRNDDRSRPGHGAQAALRLDPNAALGADRAALDRAHLEVVPLDSQVALDPEHLDHDPKLESAELIVRQCHHAPRVPDLHGRILAHIVVSAYRLLRRFSPNWSN